MKPYCICGCGNKPNIGKQYISGHNLKKMERTEEHRKKIGNAQKIAWSTKRKRLPIGSKNSDNRGYIRVKVLAGSGAWTKEHKLIVEKVLGRKLLKNEVVHHINGSKSDNRPENLAVMDRLVHLKCHRDVELLIYELLESGIIIFDRETNVYRKV